jgi:3alpha(or 20beta)-hydroxysteroid dehydrogenase
MSQRLGGKVALITGGVGGIGAAAAAAMVAEGAQVVVADVRDAEGTDLAARLGTAAAYCHLDVTLDGDWAAAVEATTERFGPPSVLANNAGVLSMGGLESVDLAEFRRIIDVNQWGCFLGMRAVIPAMRAAGGGSIINTSSVAGLAGTPHAFAYSASKWAVRGMTRAAAMDLGPDGIRVNSIHPGTIDTPMIHNPTPEGAAARQAYADRVPLRRVGEPDDVAQLMVFLASDESSYCTGAEYLVDGGDTSGSRR